MYMSDKDRRRERFNRRKKGTKQRKRKQKEKHIQQLDRLDYYADLSYDEWKESELDNG